eukprot:g62159.t1
MEAPKTTLFLASRMSQHFFDIPWLVVGLCLVLVLLSFHLLVGLCQVQITCSSVQLLKRICGQTVSEHPSSKQTS